MTKRYINIRPMFIFFVGLMVGVNLSYLFLCEKVSYATTLLILLLIVGVAVCVFVYATYTESWNKNFKSRENVSAYLRISGIFLVVSVMLGMIVSSFPISKTLSICEYYEDVTIDGVVSEYVLSEERYTACILSDCVVDGEMLDYDILLYTSSYTNMNLGDIVHTTTELDSFLADDDYGFSKLISGVGYSAYVDFSQIEIVGNDASVKDTIRTETKELLNSRLSDDNADIVFSIIFGESNSIDKEIKEQFSYAGISHILAVSGLHVSVLFLVLYFLLKKCKCNKYVSLVIMGILLLFYSYLCSFSPSVCRASIMTLLVLLCDILKIRYDGLSGLSIAGIVILIIAPLQFFSVSFRLSFLCVFAIITFMPFLSKMFTKIKVPKKLSDMLSISISISIVTLPVMMNAFDNVSLLGVLTNILVVPIFSLLYTLVIGILLLSFVFRPFGVLLYIPNLFLHIIKVISDYVSSIPFGVFRVFKVGYLVLVLVAILCMVIHFFMVTNKTKLIISLTVVSLLLGYMTASLLPTEYIGDMLSIYYSNNSNVIFYSSEDSLTMIGSSITSKEISRNLKDLKRYTIDNIVAYDFSLGELSDILDICNKFDVSTLYIPDEFSNISNENGGVKIVYYTDSVRINNLEVYANTYFEKIDSVKFRVKDKDFLVVGDITKTQSMYINNEYTDVETVIIRDLANIDYENNEYSSIICYKTEKTEAKNILNLKLCGRIRLKV
ncbi:MAG: ComEC/Rec2 family competence protein [Clostridiales bacterium]|nr:ComEC/Rec2 family competence protein [Clostridiales bacterium]